MTFMFTNRCHASFSPAAFFDKFDKVIKSGPFFLPIQPPQPTGLYSASTTGLHAQKTSMTGLTLLTTSDLQLCYSRGTHLC